MASYFAGGMLYFNRRFRASFTISAEKRSANLVTRYSPVNSGRPAATSNAKPFVSVLPRVHSIKEWCTPLFAIFCRVRDATVVDPFFSVKSCLEVTTSFVQLIRDRPTVGYVRADAAV